MRHRIIPATIFLLSILIGYHATLRAIPTIMMKGAYERLSSANTPVNAFAAPRMITADNQTIVRSSPDLLYSVCLIELPVVGQIRVRGGYTEGYGSLTIFDMNTDAVFVADLTLQDVSKRTVIIGPNDIDLKDGKGVALIRRYVPNEAAFDAAKGAAKDDICAVYVRALDNMPDSIIQSGQ